MLGRIISSTPDGTTIKVDPHRADSIQSIREPANISEVRSFLGLCQFFACSISSYAEASEPLHRLTRKNVPFVWDESCQKSFDILKAKISSPEVLVPFNPNLPTFLTTDASDVGIGAMLSQLQNGKDRPIAFASKTLSVAERNYSTPEREALACVWAAEHFEKYLLGRHFTLRTDQHSLKTLLQRFAETRMSRRISRWYDRLRHFEYSVEHIKGRDNVAADILSRMAAEKEPPKSPTLKDDDDSVIIASATLVSGLTLQDFEVACAQDTKFQLVRDWLSTSWPPKRHIPSGLQVYFQVKEELSTQGNLLFYEDRLVVPTSLQQKVLSLLHQGHPGIV